ncbi:WxL protein peptidoglycan domain-containing protein [Microtetraspora fusca]|uniref:WxL protein peptidoglycan domain-containing protein n=1 Tax=Microtetraspora fusca TaxID=1997 RepID=A0ABW6VJL2_MICFU
MHPSRPRTSTAAGSLAQATVVVLLAALGFLGVGTGPAAAADGEVSWTVRTASNDFGSGRQNYGYTLDPGGQLEDGLVVVNHGTAPLRLAVYAADGFTTEQGRLDLAAKDAKSTGVGAWVHTDRSDVTVPPGKSVEVPFTVALPDSAAPGEYMGGIVTSPAQAGEADGIDGDRRLGIRIRLRVGGELKPSLSVEDLNVRYSGTPNPFGKGDATVTYTIHNTGNAILSARQAVSVSGLFGRSDGQAGEIDDSPQLLPGGTWKVSVPIHGVVPALRLTGTVTLVPLLTDAAGSVAPLADVENTTHAWTVPWALLLFLIVLCGLVVAALASRRRRTKLRVQEGVEHPLRERETSDR